MNCQTPVPSPDFSLGLGVDFVLPLSQEQEQQQQEEPHQNIPEGNILEVLNLAKSLNKPNQTHATPLFLHQPYFPPHTFSDMDINIFEPKIFSDPKNFLDPIFYGPKIF